MELASPSFPQRLAFQSEEGKLELDGARVLIVSASAFGTLRRDLISVLGPKRAKAFLLRYGFECGYNDAVAVRRRYRHSSPRFWGEQAALMHTYEGVARVRIERREFDWARRQYVVHGVWENSYEAQEHIRLLGVSPDTSCWTLIGYAGGYLSAVMGQRVLYKEVTCVARGDAECRFVGKTVDLWGAEAERELAFYTESKIAEELDEAHRRIHRQHELLTRITRMHDELTRLVLDGRGRRALVEAVGSMLNTPVVVEDVALRPLASWTPPGSPEPEALYLGPLAASDPSLMKRLPSLTSETRAVEMGYDDHPALTPRYVAPVGTGGELMGYMSLIRRDDDSPELMRMFTERAAAAFSLELLKERIVLETESRLKGELIEEILAGPTSMEALRDRVRYMGENLDRPHRFLLLRIGSPSPEPIAADDMMQRREELYRTLRAELTRCSRDVHIVNRREELLLLYHSGDGGEETDALVRLIQSHAQGVLRGLPMSICISRESPTLETLRPVFEECRAIFDLHRRFSHDGQVIHVDHIGAFSLLYAGTEQDALVAYARRILEPLIAYDEENGSHLVPTLYTYLNAEGNLKETARRLNLSISGLKYRLQRLRSIADFDLGNPDVRFDLQVALRIYLLAQGSAGGNGTVMPPQ